MIICTYFTKSNREYASIEGGQPPHTRKPEKKKKYERTYRIYIYIYKKERKKQQQRTRKTQHKGENKANKKRKKRRTHTNRKMGIGGGRQQKQKQRQQHTCRGDKGWQKSIVNSFVCVRPNCSVICSDASPCTTSWKFLTEACVTLPWKFNTNACTCSQQRKTQRLRYIRRQGGVVYTILSKKTKHG